MSKLLDNIRTPDDIKKLKIEELEALSEEIRAYIIDVVAQNGGHLASNLGTVELTLALHRAFDFSKDRLIWDVGHQSYTHKILTGRKDAFRTLRQEDGISGFPKYTESVYDAFNTGHSSTSVSAALGMARARDLQGETYKICAVIGDGALTGGMAFEGLNDAGDSAGQLLIVLNDNEMSINQNVGGLAKYLSKISSGPRYYKLKKGLRSKLSKMKHFGPKLLGYLIRLKNALKHLLRQDMIFDDLGLKYIGPVDGHDFKELEKAIERANKYDGPVVLHVTTKKGKGYEHAENRPADFHGIAPFDVPSGGVKKTSSTSNSKVFSETLCEIAAKNPKVTAITAAMPDGTGLTLFAKQYPERFFDVGIAEQHAVTMAAGMAMVGMTPCVAVYSTFLQRAYDQMLHDVALQNLHVVFGIDRAGVVGDDGETHQGIYDISYCNTLPNFTVMAPSSLENLQQMLEYAVNQINGPVTLRYPRGCLCSAHDEGAIASMLPKQFTAKAQVLQEGSAVTIVAVGDMVVSACKAAEILAQQGIDAEVIDLQMIKPLDMDTILQSVQKTGRLVTVENNIADGGAGSEIVRVLTQKCFGCPAKILAFPNEIIGHAPVSRSFARYGLDAEGIAKAVEQLL